MLLFLWCLDWRCGTKIWSFLRVDFREYLLWQGIYHAYCTSSIFCNLIGCCIVIILNSQLGSTFEEAQAAAINANADEFIETFPEKYDTQVGGYE